ncbi:hypothetical protein SDC9_211892 [bioreactor metagenome]|uniref:Uncharacterized protein n=1 Tax=bioreactor metagenome TaxID=1076179 RepID=A0A645JKK9_9ZZZZ
MPAGKAKLLRQRENDGHDANAGMHGRHSADIVNFRDMPQRAVGEDGGGHARFSLAHDGIVSRTAHFPGKPGIYRRQVMPLGVPGGSHEVQYAMPRLFKCFGRKIIKRKIGQMCGENLCGRRSHDIFSLIKVTWMRFEPLRARERARARRQEK